jgi:hypothetical protein
MQHDDSMPPDRLTEAVDAVMHGIQEVGNHPFAARPSRLLGHAQQPEAFCSFTFHEIVEAERFLIRCGFLPSYERPASGSH